jgi:hypothetical protein
LRLDLYLFYWKEFKEMIFIGNYNFGSSSA